MNYSLPIVPVRPEPSAKKLRNARIRRTVHHHVFNTTPPILAAVALILITVMFTGVGPANRKTGTFMIIKAGEGSTATPDQAGAEVIFGLIGAAFRRLAFSRSSCC